MTWKTFRNRGEVLRSVVTVVNTRRDGLLPMDLDGVDETFEDELALLGALMLKWHARLNGHIERRMSEQPMDLEAAVVAAWCGVADELPGVRAVIDHYRAHPVDDTMAGALHRSRLKERMFLATVAGRSSVGDERAVSLGAAIEDRARALYAEIPVLKPAERPTLLDRLRAAVTAA